MGNFKVLIGLGRSLISAACLLFVLAATTSAYSIVMLGGKRVEIPAQFSVTNGTLSYETAPGFWITLQMAAVDIPATERANNEAPGSLLGRATKQKEAARISQSPSQARESRAARSVTNRDLETYKNERLQSERDYDQKLKEQGLPTLAVMRAQAADDFRRFSQELARTQAEEEANDRAAQLQAQIAAMAAQLNYLQSSGQISSGFPSGFSSYGGVPFFGGRSRINRSLFDAPFGLQIGGAFGAFGVPVSSRTASQGFRRNIIVAPGRRIGGRAGFGGSHGRPHSH